MSSSSGVSATSAMTGLSGSGSKGGSSAVPPSLNTSSRPFGVWSGPLNVGSVSGSPPPFPAITATCCSPLTAKLMGAVMITFWVSNDQSCFPSVARYARNVRSVSP